jgi:hypothetical protein
VKIRNIGKVECMIKMINERDEEKPDLGGRISGSNSSFSPLSPTPS